MNNNAKKHRDEENAKPCCLDNLQTDSLPQVRLKKIKKKFVFYFCYPPVHLKEKLSSN